MDATTFGPPCPQPGVDNYSEDCLFLNVWTPTNATLNDVEAKSLGTGGGTQWATTNTSSKLPVYVWIYGGRFAGGATSDPLYDGAGLAAKGVVVVTMNYRLGALGFLAHPELSNTSSSGTSGNYGLVDQQAALHWTSEQIAAFGGDPTKVTIGGQSAGAASVLEHLSSPYASGLFSQIIAESGATYPSNPLIGSVAESYRPSLSVAEAQGVSYLASLNLSSIEEARAAPVEVFLAGGSNQDTTYVGTVFENSSIYSEPPLFRPILDGYILPFTYQESLTTGNHSIVPILTGGNKDENGAATAPGFSVATYNASNSLYFGSVDLADEYFQFYPGGSTNYTANNASNAFFQDQTRVSTWLWANDYLTGSYKNSSGNGTFQTYTYYWTHAPPGQDQGAYHMSEINYAFNNLYAISGTPWNDTDYQIADTMSDYWVNFISTGDPNGPGLPSWPANRPENATTMELGDAFEVIPIADQERIAFVEEWFSKWPAY